MVSENFKFSPEDLESVCCPVCKNPKSDLKYEFPPFKVVNCSNCGLGYLSPRIKYEVEMELYRKGYFSSEDGQVCGYSDYNTLKPLIEKTFKKRYKHIEPFVNKEKVLDIGCAYGFGLDVLKSEFDECCGLDLSLDGIDEVNKKGYNGFAGDVFSVPWKNETFDLIVSFDTIEHIHEPLLFVEKVNSLLKQNGIVAFVTPDIESLLSKVSGKGWVSYKIPEHVLYFTKKSMEKLLKSNGFKVLTYKADFQIFPLEIVFDRLKKAFPFLSFLWIFFLSFKSLSSKSVSVPNGMFLVVAKKEEN